MIELNDLNGPDALKKDRNYFLMFYTDWCPLCPPLAETLDSLQKDRSTEFEFAKIDFDNNPEAVEFFNVTGVPFVFAIKEKSVISGWGGLINKDAYEKIVNIAFSPPDKKVSQSEIDSLIAIGKEYSRSV
jgi:thioredoxin-like negative regulator of GroEL